MPCILVTVLFFYIAFWRDCSATVGRIFTKSSPTDVFAALFVNSGAPMKIGVPKNFWDLKKSIFGAKIQTPPSSDGHCEKTRKNSGKTKTTGITKISRLPSHPHYSVRRHFSYRGLIGCAFWPMACGAVLQSRGMSTKNESQTIFCMDWWNFIKLWRTSSPVHTQDTTAVAFRTKPVQHL